MEAVASASLTAARRPHPRLLILCIEDNALHLLLRKKVLEQNGYKVIGVSTAEDALTTLRKLPVRAVIADHMLQGTTGTELAKKMKKLKPDIPIILFSGALPEHLNDVDVYVNKGEPTATFIGIVHNVVQGLRKQKSAVVKDIPKWLSLGDKVLGDDNKAA